MTNDLGKRPDIDKQCGDYFTYRDLIEAGETWRITRCNNIPLAVETYVGMKEICKKILDPVYRKFGRLTLTYAFSSSDLVKLIRKRLHPFPNISPDRDQHAGSEFKGSGKPVCAHLGQAVDLKVNEVPSGIVARWIVENTPFDCLYFYSNDRPFHVSIGPKNRKFLCRMIKTPFGGVTPSKIRPEYLTGEEASYSKFSIHKDKWYAWTMLPGYSDQPYHSPIMVHSFQPSNKKHDKVDIDFYNANYAEGVRSFRQKLLILHRASSYLIGAILYEDNLGERTAIIAEMTQSWLQECFPDFLKAHPFERDEEPQEYLDRVLASNG